MDEGIRNMQNAIIKISEERLGEPLTDKMIHDIRLFQGYMGLEFIIDTVKTSEGNELREYLKNLRNGLSH
ncbi:hypothetical protein FNO01nite_34320 [Flavobacterium noncentrifugens]|uniref:Uncharacterized protein n=1 Tax=Flavobacterium noncentrifugens TaxID=1128970 RepID=A0A1G8Y3T0_9FLAO|nr:hypothetical protein [Flavobacterium noncentrifugens]GEP52760.1 hypothetical protein FNO01nite_34320 [Flavobacterium noncentrifugens]SDJ97367.1 hypothetical protein SAMN04487935_2177 [Flavobacterium noncentrifugens]